LPHIKGGYNLNKGDREFSIFGSGSSDNNVDNTVFSISAGHGYFFTDNLEVELRQRIDFVDTPGDNFWGGSTELAADYHFNLGRIQPRNVQGQACGYAFNLSLTLLNIFSPSLVSPMLAKRDKTETSLFNIPCRSTIL
jgi:hypothetical protein